MTTRSFYVFIFFLFSFFHTFEVKAGFFSDFFSGRKRKISKIRKEISPKANNLSAEIEQLESWVKHNQRIKENSKKKLSGEMYKRYPRIVESIENHLPMMEDYLESVNSILKKSKVYLTKLENLQSRLNELKSDEDFETAQVLSNQYDEIEEAVETGKETIKNLGKDFNSTAKLMRAVEKNESRITKAKSVLSEAKEKYKRKLQDIEPHLLDPFREEIDSFLSEFDQLKNKFDQIIESETSTEVYDLGQLEKVGKTFHNFINIFYKHDVIWREKFQRLIKKINDNR